MDQLNILKDVREALNIDIESLRDIHDRLDESVSRAVCTLLQCRGKIIFIGMGKSGHVARKLAATFSSIGMPALFMHPSEATHGDLGLVCENDIAFILSKSGETREILLIISFLKQFHVKILSMVGNCFSTLAQYSDVVLDVRVEREACPLNCAPMSSALVSMALGDAIACAAINAKGLCKENFALFHPGGSLGARLLLRVKDVMSPLEKMPVIQSNDSLRQAILVMTSGKRGAVVIIDHDGVLKGIFTDGDLRKLIQVKSVDLDIGISSIMVKQPIVVSPDVFASEALSIMKMKKIFIIPVVENEKLIGSVYIQNLLANGLA